MYGCRIDIKFFYGNTNEKTLKWVCYEFSYSEIGPRISLETSMQ